MNKTIEAHGQTLKFTVTLNYSTEKGIDGKTYHLFECEVDGDILDRIKPNSKLNLENEITKFEAGCIDLVKPKPTPEGTSILESLGYK